MSAATGQPPPAQEEQRVRPPLRSRSPPDLVTPRNRKIHRPSSTSNHNCEREADQDSPRSPKKVQFRDGDDVHVLEEKSEKTRNDVITPWTGKLILTLDGGGIRGYSALIVLRELMAEIEAEERRLNSESNSSADSPLLRNSVPDSVKGSYLPCHYFDYVGGTSTGGLIAIMLGRLRMSVSNCLSEFTKVGDVFSRPKSTVPPIPYSLLPRFSRTWPNGQYEEVFDRIFSDPFRPKMDASRVRRVARRMTSSGAPKPSTATNRNAAGFHLALEENEDTRGSFRSNPSRCRTIVLCMQLSKGSSRPYIFRSYDHEHLAKDHWKPPSHVRPRSEDDLRLEKHLSITKVSVAQVAKAITAPPTYYKPFELRKAGYVDGSIYAQNPTLEVFHEVSTLHRKGVAAIDALVSIGTKQQSASRGRGILSHQRAILKKLNRSTEFVDTQMAELMQDRETDRYFRIELRGDIDEKAKDKKVLERLEKGALEYLNKSGEKERLARLAKLLVKRRKDRSKTPAWESFALGVTYVCRLSTCEKRVSDRQTLLRHWISEHGYDYPDTATIAKVEAELDEARDFDFAF